MKPRRRMRMMRWLWQNNGRVVTCFTSKGEIRYYAHLHYPTGPYAAMVYDYKAESSGDALAQLYAWAHAWARENNVTWIEGSKDV